VINRRSGLALIIVLVSLLPGCIKPVSEEPTPAIATLTAAPPADGSLPPTSTAATNAAQPTAPGVPVTSPAVTQFLLDRGVAVSDLNIWYSQSLRTDRLESFTYQNAQGLPCAGWLLTVFQNGGWQAVNGTLSCAAQPGTAALASISLFATTDGTPYIIVFGRVQEPTVSALAIVYTDGENKTIQPVNGGFLFAREGFFDINTIVYRLTAINEQGNTVIDNIPLSPPS